MGVNIENEAKYFTDQALEYLINDVMRNNWTGDFYDHLDKYGLYDKFEEFSSEEEWSKQEKDDNLKLAVSIIKSEYKEKVIKALRETKDDLWANESDIDYYKNKIFLVDGTLEENEVITDEDIAKAIKDREKDIVRCRGIINTCEKILEQLYE